MIGCLYKRSTVLSQYEVINGVVFQLKFSSKCSINSDFFRLEDFQCLVELEDKCLKINYRDGDYTVLTSLIYPCRLY